MAVAAWLVWKRVGFARSLALYFVQLALNAAWNYLFFRARNLRLSFIANIPYVLLALALLSCLLQFDHWAAWSFALYLLYQGYALWWGYRVWKLNR
mgnify:CR=1 FL=1